MIRTGLIRAVGIGNIVIAIWYLFFFNTNPEWYQVAILCVSSFGGVIMLGYDAT